MGLGEGSGAYLKSGQGQNLCQSPVGLASSFYREEGSSTQFSKKKNCRTKISSLLCVFFPFPQGKSDLPDG